MYVGTHIHMHTSYTYAVCIFIHILSILKMHIKGIKYVDTVFVGIKTIVKKY